MPTTALGRRLDQVTAEQRRQRATRRRADLGMFSDEELEELCELAHKAEEANAAGQPVEWTVEELTVLDRLGEQQAARRRWSGDWHRA